MGFRIIIIILLLILINSVKYVTGDHGEEEWAKFGYMSDSKVEFKIIILPGSGNQ